MKKLIARLRKVVKNPLDLKIGNDMQIDVGDGALVMVPVMPAKRKRFTLVQLLEGVTPKPVKALNDDTAWSREGEPVGREVA
jgi:antitoxin ChpS